MGDNKYAKRVANGMTNYLPLLLEAVRDFCYDEDGKCFGYHIIDPYYGMKAGSVVFGSQDPKKLIGFAKRMKYETILSAKDLILSAEGVTSLYDSLAKVLDILEKYEYVDEYVEDSYLIANAFRQMNNEPCFKSPCAIFAYDDYWNCWPDPDELEQVINHPEDWILVDALLRS